MKARKHNYTVITGDLRRDVVNKIQISLTHDV